MVIDVFILLNIYCDCFIIIYKRRCNHSGVFLDIECIM